jgi:signal transduction histidine kinase
MNPDPMKRSINRSLFLGIAIAVIVLISLVIFYFLMQPSMGDLQHMALFLAITAGFSLAIGYIAYRLNWLEYARSLRWVLLGSYVIASLLTFVNVWLTARLMFASKHDLLLATVLLIFAGGIAVVLGSFFTAAIIDRISTLKTATRALEKGDFSARAEIIGNDEVASLAESFNQMAVQLQAADLKQKELETLRRDLVAWAGHDLRTPLSSIRLLVEALSDRVVTDPHEVSSYLDQTKKHVDTLSLLVDDLFQISQLDAGGMPLDLEPASISDLISDTLESFTGLAQQKGITLGGSATAGVDPLIVDALWMGRALNNLVSNALRYTPPGGEINLNARLEGERVTISVTDSGEGIPKEDLPHVFERFYRGEKSRSRVSGGAGLGLAIAKGVVEAHGGTIVVDSRIGQGTTFIIALPKR